MPLALCYADRASTLSTLFPPGATIMHRLLLVILIVAALATVAACSRRMAPFAPHRTNTEDHRAAQGIHACLGCHEIKTLSSAHQPSDNCLQCHRILQGD
jgi:uncharacterized paraquat-inducible protein A